MQIPTKIPGLKWITLIVGVYAVIWIALEGDLVRVVLLAVGVTAVSLAQIIQRYLAGRKFKLWQWLILMAGLGFLLGGGSVLVILLLMTIKTGLHGHGPEFTLTQFQLVWQQLLLWSVVGLLAGLGLGLVTTADKI